MVAHDRWIAENAASDRQRLCGNTFQRSGDQYRQRLYGNSAIERLSAIVSDPTLQ